MAGRDGRAVPDDLERLGVTPLAEPGPVPRGGLDQVRLQVRAGRGLRAEGADGLELAVELLVDADEPGRPEVDGGRRRLEAEDPADLPRGHHRRVVRVAVILVDVLDRVRVDHGRPHRIDDGADDPDRGVALADPAVLEVLQVELGPEDPGRRLGLFRSPARGAAPPAAAQRQDCDVVADASVRDQGSARPDLDVVGVRADRQHDLAAGHPHRAPPGHQRGDRGQQPVRQQRLVQELIGAAAQRGDRVVQRRVGGDDRDREVGSDPAQRLEHLQAGHAGHLHVGQHEVPGLGGDAVQRGGGVGRVADVKAAPAAQHADDEAGRVGVVLDDEDPSLRVRLAGTVHVFRFSSLGRGGRSSARTLATRSALRNGLIR
jgi:hypothetical protein